MQKEDKILLSVMIIFITCIIMLVIYDHIEDFPVKNEKLTIYVNKNWPELKIEKSINFEYQDFSIYIKQKNNEIIVLNDPHDPDIRIIDFEEITDLLNEKINNLLKWQELGE